MIGDNIMIMVNNVSKLYEIVDQSDYSQQIINEYKKSLEQKIEGTTNRGDRLIFEAFNNIYESLLDHRKNKLFITEILFKDIGYIGDVINKSSKGNFTDIIKKLKNLKENDYEPNDYLYRDEIDMLLGGF